MSVSARLRNTVPVTGTFSPAAIVALANAWPKVSAMPITSPVDFISGPSMGSLPASLRKGRTTFFTETIEGTGSVVNSRSSSVSPAMSRAAYFARGTPIDLLTNGTVREARGLTSRV